MEFPYSCRINTVSIEYPSYNWNKNLIVPSEDVCFTNVFKVVISKEFDNLSRNPLERFDISS